MTGFLVILGLLAVTLLDYAMAQDGIARWQWLKQKSKAARIGILSSVFGGMFIVNILISL